MDVLQKISDYGTGTPEVARTLPQGAEILKFMTASAEKQSEIRDALYELMRHVIKCVEYRDQLKTVIAAAHSEFQKATQPATGRGFIKLPGVGDLHSRCESFLQSAKMALAQIGDLVNPFYGVTHAHKFNKLATWARNEFGKDDSLSKSIEQSEPFVARIVKMRNCVDHPKTEPGAPLVTQNFTIRKLGPLNLLVDPVWGLSGEQLIEIIPDWERKIESIVGLGELMLLELFKKHRATPLVEICEIPTAKRDPACPIRWEVRLRT